MSTLQLTNIVSNTANTPPVIRDINETEIGVFCRAWVSYNASSGIPVITSSFNITSLSDTGVGRCTLNFTQPMPTANYAVIGISGTNTADGSALTLWERQGTKTTTSVEINTTYSTATANGFADYSGINVAVFC